MGGAFLFKPPQESSVYVPVVERSNQLRAPFQTLYVTAPIASDA